MGAIARVAVFGVCAIVSLALAPIASGAANLTSVTATGHFVTAKWTVPPGDGVFVFEVSKSPEFPDDLASGTAEFPPPGENTVTTSIPLPGGHYYARAVSPCVEGDPTCVPYSNVVEVTIRSDAATLTSASLTGGVLSAAWSLPSAAAALGLEVSRSLERGLFGFLDTVYEAQLGPDETTYSAPVSLPPGLYFIQVTTTPTLDLCLTVINGCAFEVSNIASVRVPSTSSSLATPSGGAADKVVSLGAIAAKSKQDVDKLSITLNAGEAVKVKLSGSVSVAGASKVYRFKTVNKSFGAGKTKLSLKLAKKAKKAVKKALRRKKRLKAKLTLVVTDSAGNSKTSKYIVRLKP